jgi:hypothetical protein
MLSAIEQLMLRWLKASLAAPNTTISSGLRRERRLEALHVGRQHRVAHARLALDAAITSALSAICGTHLGDTKLVTSISFRPASCRRCTSSIFTVAGTGSFSFCKPVAGTDVDEFYFARV